MDMETPNVSVELVNTAFCDKVFNGQIKEAMEQSSLYIRKMLYEDGILRRLFEYRTVTADERHRYAEHSLRNRTDFSQGDVRTLQGHQRP